MKPIIIATATLFTILSVSCNCPYNCQKQPSDTALNEGFHADLFIDGGLHLTTRKTLFAAEKLGWSQEAVWSSTENTDDERIEQEKLIAGCEKDLNGVLLYPDGAPRFRTLFICGGSSTKHGKTLGANGLEAIRTFVLNGGAYAGCCAGAFIAGNGYDNGYSGDYYSNCKYYLHLWPGVWTYTNIVNTFTGMTIPENSALLDYSDLGGDGYVASVNHNGGCYSTMMPEGTEALAYYDYNGYKFHGTPCIRAYKASKDMGRMVMCGSHPEKESSGEQLDLMAAMLQYAADGRGVAKVKAELENGAVREMIKSTSDNDPAYTRIGDGQYHHFTVNIPEGTRKLKVTLKGAKPYNFDLLLAKGGFAFDGCSLKMKKGAGRNKTLTIRQPEAGKYYIAVHCTETVESDEEGISSCAYKTDNDILNGAPYTIEAVWD